MDHRELTRKAAKARSTKAAERASTQPFSLLWRSGGASTVQGYDRLSAILGLSVPSLRVLLSQGQGTIQRTMPHPSTGEDDVLTVTRLPLPDAPSAKRPRGRPRKNPEPDQP